MAEKKNKILKRQILGTIFMFLIGVVAGVLIVDKFIIYDVSILSVTLNVFFFLVFIYICFFIHIVIHEAGHCVFGLLSRYKFLSFRVANFMWIKKDGKTAFKRQHIAGTVGQCLMIPPEIENGKFPVVLYNLGGVIMNTVVALIALGIYFLNTSAFISDLVFYFSVVGFLTVLMNGVPMRTGSIDNDGYNTIAIKHSKEALYAFWIQMKIIEMYNKNVPLKNMPDEWFEVPSDIAMKNSMVAVRGVAACNRFMDQGEFEQADKLMEHILDIESGIVGIHRNLLVCDRIYCELISENRSDVLYKMLSKKQKQMMNAMKNNPTVLRTQYAYSLIAEKDVEKAEKLKQQFEKIAKTYPYEEEIKAERGLIEIAKKQYSFEN